MVDAWALFVSCVESQAEWQQCRETEKSREHGERWGHGGWVGAKGERCVEDQLSGLVPPTPKRPIFQ